MSGRRFGHLLRLLNLTAQPSSPGSGDVWYRSDTGQFRGSDGAAGEPLTIGPDGNLPVIRSAAWHVVPAYGAAGTANVPVDRMFALPFWPGRKTILTGIAGNVSLALVGGNLRMGIYLSDGTVPTTLLADYGTVTAGVTGIRSITGLSTALRPVLHYLVIGRQGGVLNLGLTTLTTGNPVVSETVTPVIGGNRSAYYKDGISGALPASFGTPDGTENAPALSVQLT